MKKRIFAALRTVPPILLGTAIYAFGLYVFVIPNELMEGGVTGIALLLNYMLDIPVSYATIALNIPLFWLGWNKIGKAAMGYTILGTVSLALFLRLMELTIAQGLLIPFEPEQGFGLSVLYAGVSIGAGLGIVFRFGGTTGGTDIVARLLSRSRGWSIGQVVLAIDVMVIGAALLYLPLQKVMVTLVVVFIASRMIHFITEGAYSAKAFTIMCDDGERLAAVITREMDRGVTLFEAKGAYSNSSKSVVYSVVARHEARKLKALVKRIEPQAFIVISDVHDVAGEGFKGR